MHEPWLAAYLRRQEQSVAYLKQMLFARLVVWVCAWKSVCKHLAETGGKFTTEVCNILALTARHLLLEVADLVDCSQQR